MLRSGVPACVLGTLYMAIAGSFDSVLPPRAAITEESEPATAPRKVARRFGAPDVRS